MGAPRRTVILGAGGLLGRHLVDALGGSGHIAAAYDRRACDITNLESVTATLRGASAVINCAAFTNVNRAETEPDAAVAANVTGAENVARAAAVARIRAIHVSTDFVFDGLKAEPYDERDAPAPVSKYGESKWHGEQRFLTAHAMGVVARVQGLYGEGGANFASKLPELLAEARPLKLDAERKVQPTWAAAAASQLLAILDSDVAGVVHVSCTGVTTWAAFTRRLATVMGLPVRFEEVPSSALPAPAQRPPNCVFDHRVLRERGLLQLPTWEAAQDAFLAARAQPR